MSGAGMSIAQALHDYQRLGSSLDRLHAGDEAALLDEKFMLGRSVQGVWHGGASLTDAPKPNFRWLREKALQLTVPVRHLDGLGFRAAYRAGHDTFAPVALCTASQSPAGLYLVPPGWPDRAFALTGW